MLAAGVEQSLYGLVWLAAAAAQLAVAAYYFSRTYAIAPTAFGLGFTLLLPLLGAWNAMVSGVPACDITGVLVTALSTTVYLTLFFAVAATVPRVFSAESWLHAATSISRRWIVGALALWLVVKAYFFSKYGFDLIVVRQVSFFSELPLLYWESILDAVVRTLLVAVVLLVTMRWALRQERAFVVLVTLVAFVVHLTLGDADAGARRTIMCLVIVYVIVRWIVDGAGRRRLVRDAAVGMCLLGALSVYYAYIRNNVFDPEIQSQLASGRPADAMAGIGALFTPQPESVRDGASRVTREGPMELLCRLTEKQWNRGTLSSGDVLSATIYRAIPRALLANKEVIEPDTVLADVHDLYPNEEYTYLDLATSQLAQLQSDFGPAGWIAAALLNVIALIVFSAVYVSGNFGRVAKLFALGGAWIVIGSAETTITTIVAGLRDFALILVIAESLRLAFHWLGSNVRESAATAYRLARLE